MVLTFVARHKVWICLQAEAATRFSGVMKRYMESLCADLRSYTITRVNDRVSEMFYRIHASWILETL